MPNRKLGKPTDQRVAMLRSLATALIMNGSIVTTEPRARELRPIAEKLITLAVRTYKDCETKQVKRTIVDKNGQTVEQEIERTTDFPSKLHARRQMMSYLYNVKIQKNEDEKKRDYINRTGKIHYPVVEKLFREIAPKYDGRNGGYTRMVKMGPRRGDAAEMVLIELV